MAQQVPRAQDSELSFHFRFPLNADRWNQNNRGKIPVGFFEPFSIVIANPGDPGGVEIPPIPGFEIIDKDDVYQYRCNTAKGLLPEDVDLQVGSTNNYLIARLEISPQDPSSLPVFMSVPASSIVATDLILGKCIYVGSTLDHIDYSSQTLSILNLALDIHAKFKGFPTIPVPDKKIHFKGGKLEDRTIPDANFTLDFSARTIDHDELASQVGSWTTMSPGDGVYIHFWIDDVTDRIQVTVGTVASSPVRPTDYPWLTCGHLLIPYHATPASQIVEFENIEIPDNLYKMIPQGTGKNFDADKLDGADRSTDTNDNDNVTIWDTTTARAYIQTVIEGLDPQDSIIEFRDFTTNEPPGPSVGDRYINTVTGTGSITTGQTFTIDYIYEWNGTNWVETIPNKGYILTNEDDDLRYWYTGSTWSPAGSALRHQDLQLILGTDPTFLGTDTTQNKHVSDNDMNNMRKKALGYALIF